MSEELENLEQRLLASPTARARFLADTLDLLERNGVDTSTPQFKQHMGGAFDLSEGASFLGGLAASTIVIAIASAGQRAVGTSFGSGFGSFGSVIGNAASTIVIAIASAGQRAVGGSIGQAASTIVIAIASAGQRAVGGNFASTIGQAASTIVIAIASAGQRAVSGNFAGNIGQAASTIVIAIASAGQRAAAGRLGVGLELGSAPITITIPAAATIAEVALALQQLSEVLVNESVAIEGEMGRAREAIDDQATKDSEEKPS